MKRFLLSLLIIAGGWGAAQDVARAEPPSAEALWALLGSISTVDIDVRSPDVERIRVVVMYEGEAVVADSIRVDSEDAPVVTLSGGALGPGVGMRACEDGALAFIHNRVVRDGGAVGVASGGSTACVPFENLAAVWDHGGAAPLNRPPEFHAENPQSVPLDTWLLFGATNLVPDGGPGFAEDVEQALSYFFMLSTEFVTPPPDQWALPTYETWREAYEAFGDLP